MRLPKDLEDKILAMPGVVVGPSAKIDQPPPDLHCSESAWQAWVGREADAAGWLWYHPWRSDKSEPGFPDCTFARLSPATGQPEHFFAELKTETGRLTQAQIRWVYLLGARVWRPSQWAEVRAALAQAEKGGG